MSKIRVLLADDHETVRAGLKLLIDTQADMTVIGEARDGRDAVSRATALKPDVVVLDVSMPKMNGLLATRAIKETQPDAAIVSLTRYGDEAHVHALLQAGVLGYVLKQSKSPELLRAIRAAAAGEQYLDSTLTARVAGAYLRRLGNARADSVMEITEREAQVLRLVAWGHSNKEIAAQLEVSVKTVEVHKYNGMRKLGLRGRVDIIHHAILQGWLHE